MFNLKVFLGTLATTAVLGLAACGDHHRTTMSTTNLVQDLIASYTNDTALPIDINDEAQIIDDSSDTDEPMPVS